MSKQIIVKAKTDKKAQRYCLNCGINISHRSKDVKFCCPACKAIYKQKDEYTKDALPEMPKVKRKTFDTNELPYKAYSTNPIDN